MQEESLPNGFVSWIRIMDSYHGFGSSDRILGSDPGFVSWVRIMDSYHGFVSRIRVFAIRVSCWGNAKIVSAPPPP